MMMVMNCIIFFSVLQNGAEPQSYPQVVTIAEAHPEFMQGHLAVQDAQTQRLIQAVEDLSDVSEYHSAGMAVNVDLQSSGTATRMPNIALEQAERKPVVPTLCLKSVNINGQVNYQLHEYDESSNTQPLGMAQHDGHNGKTFCRQNDFGSPGR
jgi:hypothetical protein